MRPLFWSSDGRCLEKHPALKLSTLNECIRAWTKKSRFSSALLLMHCSIFPLERQCCGRSTWNLAWLAPSCRLMNYLVMEELTKSANLQSKKKKKSTIYKKTPKHVVLRYLQQECILCFWTGIKAKHFKQKVRDKTLQSFMKCSMF